MIYVGLGSWVLAVVLMGLDVAGFRFAHGAGLAANALLAAGMACFIAKGVSVFRHQHDPHPHHR